jgi:hypothetical protein
MNLSELSSIITRFQQLKRIEKWILLGTSFALYKVIIDL